MTNTTTFDFQDGNGPVLANQHPKGGGWVADTASVADVTAIIGNDSWTSLKCDECGKYVDAVVQVGEEPDYESYSAKLCKPCVYKALTLAYDIITDWN